MAEMIAAQATPRGRGGVGIIRVAGDAVVEVIPQILGRTLRPREASFGVFLAGNGEVIDQGIAIYFPAPHSFTGDSVLELQGHGGPAVMRRILERTLELGARLARPGEFTERAFLNGKMDLIQAEAIADLIDAETTEAARGAVRSLQGEFSVGINSLIGDLTHLRAHLEALLDFTEEEDLARLSEEQIVQELKAINIAVQELRARARQGVVLHDGWLVAVVGESNTGKSSLFNRLLGEDAAIVADLPGTTRDVLRNRIHLEGIVVELADTAGFREQPDMIEREGIRRSQEEIRRADQILLVVDWAKLSQDGAELISVVEQFFLPIMGDDHSWRNKVTVLCNKIDLINFTPRLVEQAGIPCCYLSVVTGQGMELLRNHLISRCSGVVGEGGFSARKRHLAALSQAAELLQELEQRINWLDLELIAAELAQVQRVLGEITGAVSSEDLLDKIFSEFCIGK